MFHKLIFFSSAILLFQPCLGEPAIYQDGVISISKGAVISDSGSTYYGNITLIDDGSGNFRVQSAETRPLVQVDSVDVLVLESFPVQIRLAISGSKSVPCVDMEPPAVSRKGNAFTVVLAETVLGPAETCIAVIDPFEITVPLDVYGLEAGTYSITVNGIEAEFSFETGNLIP